ncbi:MAG: NAD-dependent epimerase/dehydratase family protein [Dehalococcoidia bacterium]
MILVTGGMGFIGLHTARRFLDAGEPVVLTQFRARREPAFIQDEIGSRVTVENLDVADAAALRAVVTRHNVTGIVHLAVPGLGALGPADDYRTNMLGLLSVLKAAEEAHVRRVCIASSIGVYGSLPAGPYREDLPLPVTSTSPTEAFKKAFEILGLHYADRAGMDVVMLRMGGIWGPLYHSMANLPSRLCHAAVQGRPPSYDGARGGVPFEEDAADICYVKDCAKGIQLLQMAEKLSHRVYNIGGGRAVANRELAGAVRAVVPGADLPLEKGRGPRAKDDNRMELTWIAEDVGYQPAFDVERGVADYIAWLRDNPQ